MELTATAVELLPALARGPGLPTGTSAGAAELTANAEAHPTRGPGLPTGTPERAAEFTTVPAQRPILSAETQRRLEDTVNHTVRAAFTLAPLAATTMAERQGAIHHAEAPASVAAPRVEAAASAAGDSTAEAAVGFTVAVAGIGNRVSYVPGSL